MFIPIEKIIVKDRIRKDFGDIGELAEDIKKNGLINPPVINKDYELLAGERRLRACKSLGWEQIPVNMMDTRDALHDLEVEISENETRKDFSRTERESIYTRKVEMKMQVNGVNLPRKKVEEDVAKEMGTSRTNMQHEKFIIKHKNMVSVEDFSDWDDGQLSTNKLYVETKKKLAEKDRKIKELENRKPEVKTVVKEVVPDDYREAKSKARAYDAETKRLNQKLTDAYNEQNQLRDRISELEEKTSGHELHARVVEGSLLFVTACGTFVRDYGGYIWITDHLDELSQSELRDYENAIRNMYAWSSKFLDALDLGKEKMLNG